MESQSDTQGKPTKTRRKPISKIPIITPDTDQPGQVKPSISYTDVQYNQACVSINSPAKIDCEQSSEAINEPVEAIPAIDPQKRPENLVSKPSLPNIPIKQRLFIKALTDPDSPSFGNQTKSYQDIYGIEHDHVAASAASRVLTSVKVKTWIDEVLDKADAGIQVRVDRLNNIARNKAGTRSITRQIRNKQGELVELKEIKEPTFSESIKADALLSKIAGDTNESKHTNKLAEIEFKELCKRTLKQTSNKVRKVKDIEQEPITGDGTEATGGRD